LVFGDVSFEAVTGFSEAAAVFMDCTAAPWLYPLNGDFSELVVDLFSCDFTVKVIALGEELNDLVSAVSF